MLKYDQGLCFQREMIKDTEDGMEVDSYLQRKEIRRKGECLVIYLNIDRKREGVITIKAKVHVIYILT